MSYSDDYRALVESARDALDELLRASTHDSWLTLRTSYGALRRAIDADDAQERAARATTAYSHAHDATAARAREHRALERIWKDTPMPRREALLFSALRDDRLTIPEATVRLNVELEASEGRRIVFDNQVRSLIMRMHRDGQLDRVGERYQGSKIRYRYFRKRSLEGPIVGLDRIYHDGASSADDRDRMDGT